MELQENTRTKKEHSILKVLHLIEIKARPTNEEKNEQVEVNYSIDVILTILFLLVAFI